MLNPEVDLKPDWILYLFLDIIADSYEPAANMAESETNAIDELIFYLSESDQHDVLRRFGISRKKMSLLTNKLKSKRDILLFLTSSRKSGNRVHGSTYVYFRDVLDLVQQLLVKVEQSRELLNSVQANYLAQLSVQLSVNSNKSNDSLNKLTVASVIFLPLNLIAGVLGMNVPIPFQRSGSLLPFFAVVGIMVMGALVFAFVCKRFKYL
ncbi:uncharacterized protein LOC135119425 [Zophobas morio]|uniref:uncharacterized protein LOC135119425 n=1 Tax=Zophobas morio TaxID=2755281 RepID=UPI00308307F0